MTARDDARDAGFLLRYALDHTLTPSRHDDYGRLLDRYHADPDLRTAFDQVIEGLGVRVLTADRAVGLVLAAEPDSPMAVSDTAPWLRVKGAEDRMIYGVALGGTAAWCYPTSRSVREPGTRRVTAVDVDRLVREHAAAVESGDIGLDAGLDEAWEAYRRRKQVAYGKGRNLAVGCTVKMCDDALGLLGAFGLLIADRSAAPPLHGLRVWRSTDRFRAHVATSGGPLAWQTIVQSHVAEQVVHLDERES